MLILKWTKYSKFYIVYLRVYMKFNLKCYFSKNLILIKAIMILSQTLLKQQK